VVGYIKGGGAIARRFAGKIKNFIEENFWARGYIVTAIVPAKRWSGGG
jgi:hypothetical protein